MLTSFSKFTLSIVLAITFAISYSSCRHTNAPAEVNTNSTSGGPAKNDLKLQSPAFQAGGVIPSNYTCDGANISPPLQWAGLPPNTKSIALIVDDPDAPGKTWVHWVVYDLAPSQTQLPENFKPTPAATNVAKQGTNDFGKASYGGPCPPQGTHRYFFRLYALDVETSLKEGATKVQVEQAMQGHILARGELMGNYQRTH